MSERRIFGPYKTNAPGNRMGSTTIMWREQFGGSQTYSIHFYIHPYPQYYSVSGTYSSLEEAIYATDKWLVNNGCSLVSEEKLNSLKVLL